jgi:hypothetical protein
MQIHCAAILQWVLLPWVQQIMRNGTFVTQWQGRAACADDT